ncbi:MAG: DUF4248 domain-containing protein [Bacteroides sp.]|nr:DUF4248 domain-containing protein [Bacteroides sp.]
MNHTRRTLAILYFPDATPSQAVRRLTRWIKHCKPLYEQLTANGHTFDKRQNLTIREVRLIMEYLGEPG